VAALAKDKAKTTINRISELGLIEMTRKRTRESLEHMLCMACPTCEGRGFVKTTETVCYEIFREILRQEQEHQIDLATALGEDVPDVTKENERA